MLIGRGDCVRVLGSMRNAGKTRWILPTFLAGRAGDPPASPQLGQEDAYRMGVQVSSQDLEVSPRS